MKIDKVWVSSGLWQSLFRGPHLTICEWLQMFVSDFGDAEGMVAFFPMSSVKKKYTPALR
jgi:hypothetical protein